MIKFKLCYACGFKGVRHGEILAELKGCGYGILGSFGKGFVV